MSEKIKKTEMEVTDTTAETMISKPKKSKYNSKRRRSKKPISNSNTVDFYSVDDVLNYLCASIKKNESETSVETNPPVKVAKESPQPCKPNGQGQANMKFSPSTSEVAHLNSVFGNLCVNSKPNKILKNKELENPVSSKRKSKKRKNKKPFEGYSIHTYNPTEEYHSEDYYSAQAWLMRMWSTKSEQTKFDVDQESISSSEGSGNSEIKNVVYDYFKTFGFPNENFKNLLKQQVQFFENKPQVFEKGEKLIKKSNKNPKEHKNEGNQVVTNLGLRENNDANKAVTPGSSQILERKKKECHQDETKNSPKTDIKFPKYLTKEELQSVSNYGVLLTGIIRINQKNYKEAYINAPDKGMDILIEGLKDRNRALEGDEVYFVLKPKEHHRVNAENTDIQRTAVVVGIKAYNHSRGAIGTLNVVKNKNLKFALFSPRDWRLPRIRIKKKNWPAGFPENYETIKNVLYFAKIEEWTDVRYAVGTLVGEVGNVGDVESETKAILLNYDLNVTPYSDELKKYLPSPNYKIPIEEISKREDFRKECIFTIDPATAADLDDAISCKKLPNGNYEVGVHISDVSFFLSEGTPLDKEAAQRATTVYLVQQAYHMLPLEMCQLGSLTPGEDKLTFSVLWEVNPEFKIIKRRFCRSVINSCAKFSYNEVQSIIKPCGDPVFPVVYNGHSKEHIRDILFFLHKMTMFLRSQRFGNGALRIQNRKIFFTLDEHCIPTEFIVEIHEESHQLIEELMLLANMAVAEKLKNTFPDIAFLRCHSPPLKYMLKKLQKNLEKYGIILDITTSGKLQNSLLKYSGDDVEAVARTLVLNNLIAKPMARAKYYCASVYPKEEDRWHYALNVPLYTHFTSPLRRYADVMTHRLLAAALGYCDSPNWTVDFVQGIASNCNKQKYAAKLAQEMSTELFLSVYIELKGPMICEAVVCDMKDKSFDCIVLSTGAHQRLYFEQIKTTWIQSRDNGIWKLTVKWPAMENEEFGCVQVIELFSIIKLRLKRMNVSKVEATLLRPEK